ncbi:type II secretion system F family protein [Solwaraspora sp. WMMD1047]|uniref:type II secretion system F family protein n=1 Tax=Solwaraspora sp. WMMD1047 TaxID=3016102 RepID=UPI0024172EB0|nr:type II secretion system F family protein [Solwaraspora sp. WMMD1047]MDG4833862.1 type II secretion system F family protein [Solwaraspora sp. WMMD1047]
MSGYVIAAATVVVLVTAIGVAMGAAGAPTGRLVRRRLAVLTVLTGGSSHTADAATGDDEQQPATALRPALLRSVAVLCGVATAVLVGGWLGVAAGVAVAVGVGPALRRVEPPEARRRRLREAAELPLAADLLAAALRAGAPVDGAVAAVAEALGGPLGGRLARVGRTMRLGGDPAEAWEHLAPVTGGRRLADAAVRSAASGGALAGALHRLADDLRGDRAVAAEAAARRAGVLIVLPLGLCFLPAFILAGLVPVIVAVLGDVL